ncbi:glycosyltransferase [Cryptosporangium sp. NPDC048952]|uniref:glycosyltransferase n=1 Tax=Cryptosporangium sp. NPDC048952 TaxID=3363961 RepID=UPI00371124C6
MSGSSTRRDEPADTEISLVIATGREYGCERLVRAVERQLQAVGHTAYEIILVLDGCPPYRWLDPADRRITAIVLPERVGIARARTVGVRAARGQLLAFLDDDCVPAEMWLTELLRLSREHPTSVAFGGRVIGTAPRNLYSQLRDAVYYYETFGPWYTDSSATTDVLGAPYVNGGNSAYRREALLSAGGFDELLPAYSDVELGRRMNLAERAVLSPGMAIHHDHPSDFRQYQLRCWRSGRARALLWAHRGYRQDRPRAVLRTIVINLVWANAARRRPRIAAPPLYVVAVLTCQEVVHGAGYIYALVGSVARRRIARRSAAHTSGRGMAADTP